MFIGKRSPLGTFSLQKSEIFVSRDTTLRSYGVKEVLAPAFSINFGRSAAGTLSTTCYVNFRDTTLA
jgi:hypothetical protein